MPHFKDVSAQITGELHAAEQAGTAGSYAKVADALSTFETQIREHIQETTKAEIQALTERLRTGAALTSEELALLRLWVVGDAEHYIKFENNFGDWLSELKRVVGEIGRLPEASDSVQNAFQLRALLRDGIRVAWDIYHYLEHKERIDAFDGATHELDQDERKTLVSILQHKLSSKEF